jgi:tetratricopeptide (TPR) repeat protein
MKQTNLLAAIIIIGLLAQFGLSRFLESNQTALPPDIAEADLYFKGETLKKISLGFDGLIADYYWMSSLQYIGNKVEHYQGEIQLDNLKPLNPRLLYPMLDTATTLDPDFTPAYSYGSMLLPAIDVEQAIKISQKGVAAQPDNWQVYHNLGFIYWKKGDYKNAAETYALGAAKKDAPDWMRHMSANMLAQGGSRSVAREMYRQIYEAAPNHQTKEVAEKRLLQIDSFDERDAIRVALENFQAKNAHCPNSWREISTLLKSAKISNGTGLRFDISGAPVDPSDAPYLLINKDNKCDVDLDLKTSKIPYQ